MNLLLTSIGKYVHFSALVAYLRTNHHCSSSLNRIVSSTEALQSDIIEIKGYIRKSSSTKAMESSKPPVVSVEGDELFKVSLSATLMENAEVLQPWGSIRVDQWVQAGRWWLLKVRSGSTHKLNSTILTYSKGPNGVICNDSI
jgi:hypothetical protein